MDTTISKSYNYDMFSFIENNRPLQERKALKKSIMEIDLTPYFPILVDNHLNIIDGQHRFIICKELGMPIYYNVYHGNDVNRVMTLLNANQSAWRQNEYLNFHAKTKGGCYKELQDFCKKQRIGLSNATIIYPEQQINSQTITKGQQIFTKNPTAEQIADYLHSEELKCLRFRMTRPFVLTVRKAFDTYTEKQLNKLKRNAVKIPMCANFQQYLTVFENIIK